jgi:thioredoxin-dependent peroxiredoxin
MLALPVGLLLAAASVEVGQVAPDFTAKDTDGNTVTLSELTRDKSVVIAFFPKAFTFG